MAITHKKIKYLFKKFHQVIYSSASISWPSLKLLAISIFEIPCLQVFNRVHTDCTKQNSLTFPWRQSTFSWHSHTYWRNLFFIQIFVYSYSEQLCFWFRVIILTYAKFLFKLFSMVIVNSYVFKKETYRDCQITVCLSCCLLSAWTNNPHNDYLTHVFIENEVSGSHASR